MKIAKILRHLREKGRDDRAGGGSRRELAGRTGIEFVQSDALGFVGSAATASFDCLASSYVLHHLTDEQKRELLSQSARILQPNGRLIVADLMFADQTARRDAIDRYRRDGDTALADDIEEEFFWDVAETSRWLGVLGATKVWQRQSDLSWCLSVGFA